MNCYRPWMFGGLVLMAAGAIMLWQQDRQSSAQAAPPSSAAASVHFGQGWSDLEWNERESWRWAAQQEADLLITNPTQQRLEAELSFVVESVNSRDLEVAVRDVRLWAGSVAGTGRLVRPARFLLPPGGTRV